MRRSSNEDVLLSLVPEDGGAVGNVALLRQLKHRGWSEEKYWNVRDQLLNDGVLVRGRGKGGSVRRVLAEITEVVTSPTIEAAAVSMAKGQKASSELSLYEPL